MRFFLLIMEGFELLFGYFCLALLETFCGSFRLFCFSVDVVVGWKLWFFYWFWKGTLKVLQFGFSCLALSDIFFVCFVYFFGSLVVHFGLFLKFRFFVIFTLIRGRWCTSFFWKAIYKMAFGLLFHVLDVFFPCYYCFKGCIFFRSHPMVDDALCFCEQ